jgi:hypothetical protein
MSREIPSVVYDCRCVIEVAPKAAESLVPMWLQREMAI